MDWEEPDEWFQGVKAVVDMDPDAIDDRFDIGPDEGAAHLFSGDLFEDVRGGGFLYTNEDSLSIGTVFHLDSLVEQEAEPHELLDALLTHPLLAGWFKTSITSASTRRSSSPTRRRSPTASPIAIDSCSSATPPARCRPRGRLSRE